MKLIKTSIKRPITVLMFYLLIILTGVISFTKLPIEFLPEMGFPKLTVITNYENSTPEEVEELVTTQIEEVVATLKGVKEVSSISRAEVSVVTVKYNWGTEMSFASLDLREKLDNIKYSLPDGAERPNIARLDPSEEPVMYLGVYSDKVNDVTKIQKIAENLIKRRLQQLDGVASADIIGDLEEEIKIIIDEKKIASLGLELQDIENKINYANISNPSGQIKEGHYKFNIKLVGEFRSVEDIAQTAVAYNENGGAIQLKDIAEIKTSFKDEKNITRLNERRSLGILIRKESNANTVRVCTEVKKALKLLREKYPDIQFKVTVDHSEFIKESIFSVLEAILIGGFLAFIILFFFLKDAKSPMHISLVIPVAILAAFILMFFNDISLNIISLSGLALGVGMLVDNSIVVSENIFRHRSEGKSWKIAAYDGTKEVGLAIIASTLTTLAVFVPIVYIKGIAAALFKEQALTVTFSLLASLLVSITMLPLLASLRDKREKIKKEKKEKREHKKLVRILIRIGLIIWFPFKMIGKFFKLIFSFIWRILTAIRNFFWGIFHNLTDRFQERFDKFREKYGRLLEASLKRKGQILILFVFLFGSGIWILSTLNIQFFPEFEQKNFTLLLKTEPGTPLEKTDEVVQNIEQVLVKDKRIESFFSSIGKSTEDKLSYYLENSSTENLAEIKINVQEDYKTSSVISFLRKQFEKIPASITFKKGSNSLLSFLEFEESGLMINIYGNNSDDMKFYASKIKDKILADKNFYDVKTDYETEFPQINLKINRDALALYDVPISRISGLLETYVSGEKVDDFHQFNEKIDITLKIEDNLNLQKVLNKHIILRDRKVPLRALVEYKYVKSQNEIIRSNQIRKFAISMKFKGKTKKAVAKLENLIEPLHNNDKQVNFSVGGINDEIQSSMKSLGFALGLAIILVYMILASQFESFKLPFIIMFVAPMGLIGVAVTLFITGTSLNIMSTLGMIILSGIIVNDAILLVDYTVTLKKSGFNSYDAVVKAAKTRLRPILMTTFTTVFGLLPLALGLGSGAELQSAMAVSVIGGMISATFLTLILIPVLFLIIERR